MNKLNFIKRAMLSIVFSISTGVLFAQSGYVVGDFHQHTTFTDGSYSIGYMMQKNADFGLDWWANSEHGGAFNRWGKASGVNYGSTVTWDKAGISLLGDNDGQNMFRWQSLMNWSFPEILMWRRILTDKVIIQGYEMNVPGHEHGSVGLINGEFDLENPNANALAEFEYKFDNNDRDVSGGAAMGWEKSTKAGHKRTLEAIEWLQTYYAGQSWLVPAHPERKQKYSIADFRDMNNAGPDVCFGFESMPGHQKSSSRGGYGSGADGGGTYGGCGVYAAQVGGLWDAMLSEGRQFWLFASSDFHSESGDFYPGEYQKTYTYVTDKKDPEAIVAGLRSGNSWIVEGDLIDMLNFNLKSKSSACMGETLEYENNILVEVTLNDPKSNNNFDMNPTLDHVDLIMGKVTGYVEPDSDEYDVAETSETKVIARFDANGGVTSPDGITSIKWKKSDKGKITIKYLIKNAEDACYFRLRGTNQGLGVENETDENGNPILDSVLGTNTAEKAIADLWFYSNPIFATPAANTSKNKSGSKEKGNSKKGEQEVESTISIYPNPANDIIYFTNADANSKVDIYYSLSGNKVISSTLNDNSLNVSGLRKGVYMACVEKEGEKVNVKFVVE